ncbi:NADH-quinone oxidoreductase subunit J [Bacillus kwashiorkori]|uniref:NADH-quinone oxidoreductase subunit J n=1 Tax=Bacillus kwashiorkori TaxID=1522318 RepID=UPI0007806DC4|nr:NADH-quinone oxidoreductase subunit J [Bacillus kwashiorkori]
MLERGGELVAFVLLALCALTGAVLFIFIQNVVYALLSVVLTFISIAGIYILLSAEFLAGAQILIYTGAVTIILLFAIMLTKREKVTEKQKGIKRKNGVILLVIATLTFFVSRGISNIQNLNEAATLHEKNTEKIGEILFTKYIIPFELTSIILLVALIGAIVLARKEEG